MSHPRLGVPNMWFKLLTFQGRSLPMYSPFSLWYSPWALVPTMIVFPSYPASCGHFLKIWLYLSLAASLQSVFSENYSTLRCMSEVIVGQVSSTSFFTIWIDSPLYLFCCPVTQILSSYLQLCGLQHDRLPRLSPSPGVCPTSCLLR